MGTHSTISIENDDGTVTGIYCHFDGYVSHNGAILFEHYTTEEQIRALIDLGDLSSLGREIGEQHPFDNPHGFGTPAWTEHWDRHRNWCMAYGRDRGETGVEADTRADLKTFMEARAEEFNYHFRSGQWYVSEDGARFAPLQALLAESFTV